MLVASLWLISFVLNVRLTPADAIQDREIKKRTLKACCYGELDPSGNSTSCCYGELDPSGNSTYGSLCIATHKVASYTIAFWHWTERCFGNDFLNS